jgi:hypothetical protein
VPSGGSFVFVKGLTLSAGSYGLSAVVRVDNTASVHSGVTCELGTVGSPAAYGNATSYQGAYGDVGYVATLPIESAVTLGSSTTIQLLCSSDYGANASGAVIKAVKTGNVTVN